MTDHENLMKRCQRGATNLNDANNLLAECYGMLGKLGAENKDLSNRCESLTFERTDLRDKIETLRDVLPECKNCQGGGQVNDGFCSFDCWECGGTGCSSST